MAEEGARSMTWDDIDLAVHELSVMSDLVYELVRESAYGEPMSIRQHDRAIVMASLVAERLIAFQGTIQRCELRKRAREA